MKKSPKWRQIHAYLRDIKSAKTIEELEIAVKDDPRNPLFEGMVWKHERSMRENRGNNWYGLFHNGERSATERYALKLEDLFTELTNQFSTKKNDNRYV